MCDNKFNYVDNIEEKLILLSNNNVIQNKEIIQNSIERITISPIKNQFKKSDRFKVIKDNNLKSNSHTPKKQEVKSKTKLVLEKMNENNAIKVIENSIKKKNLDKTCFQQNNNQQLERGDSLDSNASNLSNLSKK